MGYYPTFGGPNAPPSSILSEAGPFVGVSGHFFGNFAIRQPVTNRLQLPLLSGTPFVRLFRQN